MSRTSDERFKGDWEAYLATLMGPRVPRSVARMIEVSERDVLKCLLPVEETVT